MRWFSVRVVLLISMFLAPSAVAFAAAPNGAPLKAGIIGVDAHALPWTQIINKPKNTGLLAEIRIVAAFPGGSPDIPASMSLLKQEVEPVRALGVEMVDSIDTLLKKVDVVLLLSIDGRKHLEQAKPVFAARKPVFIDKPVGGTLADAIKIYDLAKKSGVPCFSSSGLRYGPRLAALRNDPKIGAVRGCDAFSPCSIEPHHPDFYWYGVHGVEPLFTIMGTGCKTVTRVHAEGADVAVGLWADGRIGTFRGTREGAHDYGATVFGSKGIGSTRGFEGYEHLITEIVKFFKTGKAPVSAEETIEIMAFMEAADESKRQGGCPVSIESVMAKARAQAAK